MKEEGPADSEEDAPLPVPQGRLNDDNIKLILQSEEFATFIERSSLVMERALAETTDLLFDLSAGKESEGVG